MIGRRIALVLGTSTGGIGRHVAAVARHLVERGDQVSVLGPRDTDAAFGFAASGARFRPVEIAAGIDPRDTVAVWRLRRAFDASGRGLDVVHAHGMRAGLLSALARPAGVPLVTTWHNLTMATGARGRVFTAAERYLARSTDMALCASGDLVERVIELGAVDARPIAVAAPNRAVTGDAGRVAAELAADGRPVVLSVGRLHPQKDFGTLITAAARWTDLTPAPLVLIVGDGPDRAELAARIADGGAEVRLLGQRDDVPDLLAAADVAVVSSTWEARQLFAQEALRAGVPLVATRVGGIPELVGQAAILVEPGDAAALADGVRRVLGDPATATRLAEDGPKQAAGWPTEADMFAHLDAVYAELAGR